MRRLAFALFALTVSACGQSASPMMPQPKVTGGAPTKAGDISNPAVASSFWYVTDKSLKHPKELRDFFRWECTTTKKDICMFFLWDNYANLRMNESQYTDDAIKKEVGRYNRNRHTNLDELTIRISPIQEMVY